MFIRKGFLFTLTVLIFTLSFIPVYTYANQLELAKKIVEANTTSIGDATKDYYDHSEWNRKYIIKADKWEKRANDYYPTLEEAFDNYKFYSDWLGGAEMARDAAQSRITDAIDMLYQLGSVSSQNEQAIRYWEEELKSAREEHKIQTELIDSITPKYETAKKDYDKKHSIWNGKYKLYIFFSEKATEHLVSMGWIAVSIRDWHKENIKYHNDNPDLGPCPSSQSDVDYWNGKTMGMGGDTA